MTNTTQTFEKKLIVNGSLNTTITLEEILTHYPTSKDLATAAWNIIVKLNVYHKIQDLPTYKEVEADARNVLQTVWKLNEKIMVEKKAESHLAEMEEGKQIFNFFKATPIRSKSFKFEKPEIPMSPSQATGYLSMTGEDFNYYTAANMQKALEKIEALNIRQDYGVNNCNTGKEITTYVRNGDHWLVSFSVSERQQEVFLKTYESELICIGRQAKADVSRIETSKFDVTLVLWWD
ncbi:hypothetical protein [Vibrio crassostreae]|uniref:hypothetical protein n=1 Tax=Vibrio crassostreae TaxID=246167 RepID=UPI001B31371C|nr:hypothetical protein [Vibrio crassostreae]